MILEQAIPLKIAEYVPQEKFRKSITTQTSKTYKTCLAKIQNTAKDFDTKFAKCNADAINDATFRVFSLSLDLALEEHFPTTDKFPGTNQTNYGVEFNREKHQRIRAKLLNAAFRKSIAETNASGGGFSLTLLSYGFKIDAGLEIAKETFVLW